MITAFLLQCNSYWHIFLHVQIYHLNRSRHGNGIEDKHAFTFVLSLLKSMSIKQNKTNIYMTVMISQMNGFTVGLNYVSDQYI